MPGDQWIARHVTVEQVQGGVSLTLEFGQGDHDGGEDDLETLPRRLRARGIAAHVAERRA